MSQRRKHDSLVHAAPEQPTAATNGALAPSNSLFAEEAIRLCAYHKWQAAGQPPGDGAQFWLAAEQELVAGHNDNSARRTGWHGHHEQDRLQTEKAAAEHAAHVDIHYRDNNRMFQTHSERGHRHGGG